MNAGRVYGVVLAAGEGRRMGVRKASLSLGGTSLLAHHLSRLAAGGCEVVAAVVRPEDETIAALDHAVVVGARTRDPAESLARGLGALPLTTDDIVIVAPVDTLPPRASTVRALIQELRARPAIDAVTPTHRGQGGHPVAVRFVLVAGYVDGRVSEPLRDVVRRARRLRLDVDDDAIVTDLDTPADAAAHGVVRPRTAESRRVLEGQAPRT